MVVVKLVETPLTFKLARSDCWFSPLPASHFHVNQLREFGTRSIKQLVHDKLNILIACLLDNVWILKGEVTF